MNLPALSPGFTVGHWTHPEMLTGCTVVIAPQGTVGSYDIRGGSPSTRELAHLDPDTKLTEVNAVVLSGGSAYGLSAADGVVRWLESRELGYSTPIGRVPIVAGAVVFDRSAEHGKMRPGPDEGRAACEAATENFTTGRVGAGAGATVGKWGGLEHLSPGGLGFGGASEGELEVRALAVANAVGDIVDDNGTVLAGTTNPSPSMRLFTVPESSATVLAILTTNVRLGKRACRWLAARGSDGITTSVRPAHTRYDGDIVFALSHSAEDAPDADATDLDLLSYLATRAVASAVRNSVVT